MSATPARRLRWFAPRSLGLLLVVCATAALLGASPVHSIQTPPGGGLSPADDLGPPSAAGGPGLRLTWSADRTHVGVPVDLTITALGEDGQSDPTRGGTVAVQIGDPRAVVLAGAPATAVTGQRSADGQVVRLPLTNGVAQASVRFTSPNLYQAEARLEGAAAPGGSSDPLDVQGVFFAISTPPDAASGRTSRVTVTVQDTQGQPVPGYVGDILLRATDPAAIVTPVGPGSRAGSRMAARSLSAQDGGQASFDVTFAKGGAQSLEVVDGAGGTTTKAATLLVTSTPEPVIPLPTPSPTPATSPTPTPTATAGTATPQAATATPSPILTATATAPPASPAQTTTTATATSAVATATASVAPPPPTRTSAAGTPSALLLDALDRGRPAEGVTTSLTTQTSGALVVTLSGTSTHAGVPLNLTVRAVTAGRGAPTDPAYRGTVQFVSTDPTFTPGVLSSYTFTAADAGIHIFPVQFLTAGNPHTITVFDTATPSRNATTPNVTVAETVFTATWGTSPIVAGGSSTLTVQAKNSGGSVVPYQGTVLLSTNDTSVRPTGWGAGVSYGAYTFTAADAGTHIFTPTFDYSGYVYATVTDAAHPARTVTTATSMFVQGPPSFGSARFNAPSGVRLADGSSLWAFLTYQGRLLVRRNVGTLQEPAWMPPVVARELGAGYAGADSPSLVLFGSTLALFHTYSDGAYDQVWVTTSADSGATWSSPVKLTNETTHVRRAHAVVAGGTLYLFWSRKDSSGQLSYQTTTNLTTWSAIATAGQAIGVDVASTTSTFSITRLSSGSWLLAWLEGSINGEAPNVQPGDRSYPTVHVATSANLTTWSSAVELNLPLSERAPVALAVVQDAAGTIRALYQQVYSLTTQNVYISQRTSTDGVTWTPKTWVGYDRSRDPNAGDAAFYARYPAFLSNGTSGAICGWTASVTGGYSGGYFWMQPYGAAHGTELNSGYAVMLNDCAAPVEQVLLPYGEMPEQATSGLFGQVRLGGTDLGVPARGMPLGVVRGYSSLDAIHGRSGPFGYGWHWTYSTRAVTHADGSVSIIEPSGRRAIYWKTGATWTPAPEVDDALTAVIGGGYLLTRHNQLKLTFDAQGKLTSIADRNGNTHTLTYTGGLLTSVSTSGTRSLTITNDGQGRITRIDGPAGLSASYTYDANGNLATARDTAGAVTTYAYDSRHQLTGVTDANNRTTTYIYGSLGRLREHKDALNQSTHYFYAQPLYTLGGGPATLSSIPHNVATNPRGVSVHTRFDRGFRPLVQEAVQSATLLQRQQWEYDAKGNPTVTTDSLGLVTTISYDSRSNPLTITADAAPGGAALVTSMTYNATNDVLTTTNPLNQTASIAYDANGNPLTVTNAMSQTTTMTYTSAGLVASVTDATNRQTAYTYNSDGDRLTTTAGAGTAQASTTTTVYDTAGRPTSVTDALNRTATMTYDGMGRQLTATNPLNQTATAVYDAAGAKTQDIDPLGRITKYDYDALYRLTAVTNNWVSGGSITGSQNVVTSYAYDAVGNRTSVTNALGKVWTTTYDGLNRPLTTTDPLNRTTTTTYNVAGRVTQVQKADGTVNRNVYDRLQRLVGIDMANNGTLDIQWVLDAIGRRTRMIDATGTTLYSYNHANQLTSMTASVGGTVGYAYDAAGRRTTLTYPSSHQVASTYTSRGELATVTDWRMKTWTYTYDAAGQMTQLAAPEGIPHDYAYDSAGRLTSMVQRGRLARGGPVQVLSTLAYTYDAAGNRLSQTETDAYNQTVYASVYTYDGLHRLASEAVSGQGIVPRTESYAYDGAGNRTSRAITGLDPRSGQYNTTTTYTYDHANQLLDTRINGVVQESFSYDANGNQLTKNGSSQQQSYTFDGLNRLTSVTTTVNGTPTTENYTYNGDGLRVTGPGLTGPGFVWDITAKNPLLLSDGGEYIYGHVLLAQVLDPNDPLTVKYLQRDALGSITDVLDDAGVKVGESSYSAYGEVIGQSGLQLPVGFAGEQRDPSSLVYLRARFYQPGTGRFLSQDPLWWTLGAMTSAYTYAANNPTNLTDPSGLCPNCPAYDDNNTGACMSITAQGECIGLDVVKAMCNVIAGMKENCSDTDTFRTIQDCLVFGRDCKEFTEMMSWNYNDPSLHWQCFVGIAFFAVGVAALLMGVPSAAAAAAASPGIAAAGPVMVTAAARADAIFQRIGVGLSIGLTIGGLGLLFADGGSCT